jgi:hypothetical protein
MRWRVRTLLIAVALAAVALFGIRLRARWLYHQRITAAIGEYELSARNAWENTEAYERLASEAEKKAKATPGPLTEEAARHAKEIARIAKLQAQYFEDLARKCRGGAARPWYESAPIPAPASPPSMPGPSSPNG